jgi:hypothetical protein
MSEKAIKFIRDYEQNNSTYDNGYLLFNSGYFNNSIWFRFNVKINDWEWSNDLIYWNKKYDNNSKSSIWINSLLDRKTDINYILSYLRLCNVNKNILQMNDPIQQIYSYIDQLYNITLEFENNKILDNEIKSNFKLMNFIITNAKEHIEQNKIKETNINNNTLNNLNEKNQVIIHKDTLNNLNNSIRKLNQELLQYKNNIINLSNYLTNIDNNFETNHTILHESLLIYQSSLLCELNVNSSNSISENTNLLYTNINMLNKKLDEFVYENNELKEKLDDQIFEKNLCEKRINGNRFTIKSLELKISQLHENISLSKKEKQKLILEIEGYKNTIEGNTVKIFGITQELDKKNNIISNLMLERENLNISKISENPILESNNENKDDYDVITIDELI